MKESLRELGLTEGEVEVFLALLELGPSTNTPIARKTGLQSSSVYYCLNRLVEKGFVSYINRRGRKHYMAADPDTLLHHVDEEQRELAQKRERLATIVPKLQQQYAKHRQKTTAEIFEGLKGMRQIFSEILETLEPGEEYVAFVVEEAVGYRPELSTFFKSYNREAKKKGLKLRLLAPARFRGTFDRIYGQRFLAKFQAIRYTDETIPVGITIYRDTVVTHIEDAGKLMQFRIRNRQYAKLMRSYFDSAWRKAEY